MGSRSGAGRRIAALLSSLALAAWRRRAAARRKACRCRSRRRSRRATARRRAPRPAGGDRRRASSSQRSRPQQTSSGFPSIFPSRPPCSAGPARPPPSTPGSAALADRVSAYLSGVRQLHGNFVQVGPDGGKSEGEFYLQKPGKVRFDYNPPSPIELIADGQSVVVRDRKLATQDLYPLSQTPLRFLLADRIDLMRDTNLVGVYADDVFVTVVIEERQILGGTHRVMLMFGAQDFQLRQWTVTDPQGYDTTVAVYNLDTSRPARSEHVPDRLHAQHSVAATFRTCRQVLRHARRGAAASASRQHEARE